jgi:hypothetical protein
LQENLQIENGTERRKGRILKEEKTKKTKRHEQRRRREGKSHSMSLKVDQFSWFQLQL